MTRSCLAIASAVLLAIVSTSFLLDLEAPALASSGNCVNEQVRKLADGGNVLIERSLFRNADGTATIVVSVCPACTASTVVQVLRKLKLVIQLMSEADG